MTPHLAFLFALAGADLDPAIPTPESVLGEKPGSDFYLADYDESRRYFQLLAAASDRVKLERVGESAFGLPWDVAIISGPRNLERFEEISATSRRLALAKDLTDDQARQLADETRVIVHIDAGLHATEAACAQHSLPLAYRLAATRGDPLIDAILTEVVLVLWFSMNPDGQNMMVDWYRRNLGTEFEVSPMVRLYQKYAGHDNNRDGYMNNLPESRVVTAATLRFQPHVFYNHHQTAPFPARIWIPPFAEPITSNVHPLMWRQVNQFGTSMATWLDERGMEGAIHRGNGFDDWYPGFIDHTNSFRHTVSFLTETALYRYATPRFYTLSDFPDDKRDLRAETLYASPWKGGWWRLGDAVDYMVEASMAVLDTAARYRRNLVYNRYQAGRDTIERFRREPPFAYVIPSDQRDPGTAAALVETLMTNGVEVHRASRPFRANGNEYAEGDVVVLLDQSFGALVKELFEVQDYPELRMGEGGPLDLPYDVAGWTLPIQMAVECHAVVQPLTADHRAALQPISAPPLPTGGVDGDAPHYALPLAHNATYGAIAAAAAAGGTLHVIGPDGAGDHDDVYVSGLGPGDMNGIAAEHRVPATAVAALPDGVVELRVPRVGVIRPWSPSIDEGWTRWLLDRFKLPYASLRNDEVIAGGLRDKFDVILIADISGRTLRDGYRKGTVPPEYAGGLGEFGVAHLREFVADGGTLVCFDSSANFAIDAFALDVDDAVADKSNDEFFCAGSLLRTSRSGARHPLLFGVDDATAIMFARSPAFTWSDDAEVQPTPLLTYPDHHPLLLSGFLIGDDVLRGNAALVEVPYEDGRLVLFGFRPQWRGQPHGTFRLIFNALLYDEELAQAFAVTEGTGE